MKKLSFIALVITIGLFTQSTSCRDPKNAPGECGDIACTMMFAMITVEVKDINGNPVILDEYYTTRESNGDKITTQSQMPDSGTYTVLDDNFVSTLKNRSEKFRFIGKKNGAEVINESYTISADCCHVNKDSGKGEITL